MCTSWYDCGITAAGEALLFLMPSEEEGMLKALQEKKIPIKQRSFSARKVLPVKGQLGALLAEHEELKLTAQAAFLTYMRSVFLNPRHEIFDVSKLNPEAYASSMGLLAAPHQRAVKKMQKHSQQSATRCTQKVAVKEVAAASVVCGWQSMPYEEAVGQGNQLAERVQQDDEENDEQAALDGSDSNQGDTCRRRNSDAAGLAMDLSDEQGHSSDTGNGEDGDMLTVRRRDVLGQLAEVEAAATQARYSAATCACCVQRGCLCMEVLPVAVNAGAD